jgi:phosphopantetheinyl transferase (holo-ACP synthase)
MLKTILKSILIMSLWKNGRCQINIRNRFQIKSTVIGNDIVDLALARKESNWKRPGYLNKIFTTKEQLLISSAENPNTMVWNLWSRKGAAYKIYNRATGIRGYFPLNLECAYENSTTGSVAGIYILYENRNRCGENTYYRCYMQKILN